MTDRISSAVIALGSILAAAPGASAQSGSCCQPSGACIIASSAAVCANSTNKGVFVGNAVCTPGLLGDCFPDVFVYSLQDATTWGRLAVGTKNVHAFSFGTYSCNAGTSNVSWISSTPAHPAIAQDLFRVNNVGGGRIEHIGMAWLKHGFFALSNANTGCGPCTWHTDGTSLGVGCSDPYSASGENGTQSRLGPRSIVNATTGVFPYSPGSWPVSDGTVLARRLQVDEADLNNTGATYWVQGQYVTADDAQAGRGLNNASYRRVTFGAATTYTPAMQGSTITRTPVIYAWHDNGGGLGVADPAVMTSYVDVPGDGRFYVASKATDLGGGMWHYEYAVQNLNSDRSGGGLSVAIPYNAAVTNVGFHAPLYHSGEPYDNSSWVGTVSATGVRWDPAALPSPNPLNLQTNAVRFATLYNYRFDAPAPPVAMTAPGQVTLSLFKPGTPASVVASAIVPYVCPGDFNGVNGATVQDIFDMLSAWFVADPHADFNAVNGIDVQDILDFLAAWFLGC